MGLKRSPDAALKAAMLTAILGVAALGAVVGLALAWLLARLVPVPTTVAVLLAIAGAIAAIHRVFPDILRSIVSDARAPTLRFLVPAGFTGRFTLVVDPAGLVLTQQGRRAEIPVPVDRLLRVCPCPMLEHTDPRIEALRDGSLITIVPDESGQQHGVVYRSYYVGTYAERDADPGPPRLR